MTRLKPDHVFDIPGVPDWLAIDEHVWVSNSPKNTVTRIDPKANKIVETIAVGKDPCSGLAAGFRHRSGSPTAAIRACRASISKTGKVTATLPLTIGNSEGGLATGAGSVWMMTDAKGTLARHRSGHQQGRRRDLRRARIVRRRVWRERGVGDEHREEPPHPRQRATPTSSKRRSPSARSRGSSPSAKDRCGRSIRATARSRASTPRPTRSSRRSRPAFPGRGGEIAVGEGSVWVTSFEYPITRIDPVDQQGRAAVLRRAATLSASDTARSGCRTCARATSGGSIRSASRPQFPNAETLVGWRSSERLP